MASSDTEFAAKCIPPKRNPTTLIRRRLLDVLHSNVGKRAQLLAAPAGYGKTTLLIDFTDELEVPVCWYTIDAVDLDTRSFIEGITKAIRARFHEFGNLTGARLGSCKDLKDELPQLARALTGEFAATITDYCVLVLEDFHNVEHSETTRAFVSELLEHLPENCHVIISSRKPLDIPSFARLRLRQAAAELGVSQLAFTQAEAKSLLAQLLEVNLTDQEIERLITQTEGWVLGILLSTYNLRSGMPKGQTTAVSRRDVFQYLDSEIFDRQPPDAQEFLLVSATFDQIEPEICDALLGKPDTLKMLRSMETEGLFLQCVDHDASMYRYHQIFRDFLQRKLLEENTRRYLSLHERAAAILEEFGRHKEAIAHLIKARDYEKASRLIKATAPQCLKNGKWTTIAGWIEALPESKRDIELRLFYAQSLIYLGKTEVSIRLLNEIIDGASEDKDYLLRATALNWRSAAFALTGHGALAQKDIEEAVELLEKHPSPDGLLGEVYKRLGKRKFQQGKLNLAERYLKKALSHYLETYDVAEMSDTYNCLGVIYGKRCQTNQASINFEKARQGWAKLHHDGWLATTLINIAHLQQRRGQFDSAQETLKNALAKAGEAGYTRVQALVLLNQAEILRDVDKFKDALEGFNKGLTLAREVAEPYIVAWAKAGLAETHRLLGNRDRAEALIKEAIAEAADQGLAQETALFSVQLGILDYERGDYKSAVTILQKAARRLTALSDKDASAKTFFHLAQAHFLNGETETALEWLKKSCELAKKLGYDEYLAIEGKKGTPLFEHAISRNIETERLTAILEKIRQRRNAGLETGASREATVQRLEIMAYAFAESKVVVNGKTVDDFLWRSGRAREIFFFLLTSKTGQTREAITAAIWPDLSPARATSNFHINLYRVRHAINPGLILLDQGRYKINPALEIWYDANKFEEATRLVHSALGDSHALTGALEKMISIYRGDFLTDVYSDWAEEKRQYFHEAYLRGVALLARLFGENGQHSQAIELLEKYIDAEPYQADAYCSLIEQHLAMDDEVSAYRAYHRFTENIGTDNSPASARMRDLRDRLTAPKNK